MVDYGKKKNDELVALLKERGLPHTGKKADMVQRLTEHDTKQTAAPAAATKADDEEIDWDDDIAQTATTETSKEAVAAGGVGEVKNPVDVPNQEPAIDPAQDESLTVAAEGEPKPVQEEKAPEKDFSAGITEATLDEEIEKRRARARKFGLPEDDDQIKLLQRAKKFGITENSGALGLLNVALSEGRKGEKGEKKGGEKRGLDTALSEETGRKKGKFRHGRGGKQGGQRAASGTPKQNGAGVEKKQGGTWMSEADRARAEARKARFAATT